MISLYSWLGWGEALSTRRKGPLSSSTGTHQPTCPTLNCRVKFNQRECFFLFACTEGYPLLICTKAKMFNKLKRPSTVYAQPTSPASGSTTLLPLSTLQPCWSPLRASGKPLSICFRTFAHAGLSYQNDSLCAYMKSTHTLDLRSSINSLRMWLPLKLAQNSQRCSFSRILTSIFNCAFTYVIMYLMSASASGLSCSSKARTLPIRLLVLNNRNCFWLNSSIKRNLLKDLG